MTQLKRLSTSSSKLSPIARIKTSEDVRAKVDNVMGSIVPNGYALPNYYTDWVDYAVMGAISTTSFLQWVMGSKVNATQEAHYSGVRVRKATIAKYGQIDTPKPLDRFKGLDDFNAFITAKPQERETYLKDKGLV